jgi:hypothetical protein
MKKKSKIWRLKSMKKPYKRRISDLSTSSWLVSSRGTKMENLPLRKMIFSLAPSVKRARSRRRNSKTLMMRSWMKIQSSRWITCTKTWWNRFILIWIRSPFKKSFLFWILWQVGQKNNSKDLKSVPMISMKAE